MHAKQRGSFCPAAPLLRVPWSLAAAYTLVVQEAQAVMENAAVYGAEEGQPRGVGYVPDWVYSVGGTR